MIDFSSRTFENLLNEKLQMIPNSIDKEEGGMVYVALAPNSYELSTLYEYLSLVQIQGSWRTATGQALDDWVAVRSIYRLKATPAVRVGTFNVNIPEGTRFATLQGNIVYVSGAYIEGTNYQYQLTCETAGIIGNNYVGDLLAIDYVAGLESATIGDILISGEDEETDEALRTRFENSLQIQSFGGNIAAYKNKIESINSVGQCQVYPAGQYQGGSTVLCVITDSTNNIASPTLIANVQNEICPIYNGEITNIGSGFAPIGAKVTIATGTTKSINISCTLQVSSGQPTDYQTEVENKIRSYIAEAMQNWGVPIITDEVNYNVIIYRARIIQYILQIANIINVTDLLINGVDADLTLIENGTTQEIAVFGGVTING